MEYGVDVSEYIEGGKPLFSSRCKERVGLGFKG
jgi:hypothetical protein